MASTAQDASAPLRGPEKKDEDSETPAVEGLLVSAPHAPFVLTRVAAAEYSPFYGIEKGAVLQEARCFNDPHIDARRCQQVCPCTVIVRAAGHTHSEAV